MQIDYKAVLLIVAALTFILCTYAISIAISMKNRANDAKRKADEYMELYSKLEALLATNDHCCSTCIAKTTCPHSLGDADEHWIACPMWSCEEANKDPILK